MEKMSLVVLPIVLWMMVMSLSYADLTPGCQIQHSRSTPAPMPNLTNCPQYRDQACCTYDTDSMILPNTNGTGQLYGFNWDRCGPLSPACTKFFQAESCYFECDPYQTPWADRTANSPYTFAGVPICSTYCDAWFAACMNDSTCGTEWLIDFVDDPQADVYVCANGSLCKTFAEVYNNAQGLCDILWGSAFHYSEDLDNCVVWDFALTEGNPNRLVTKTNYSESFCNVTYLLSLPQDTKPSTTIQPQCLYGRELSTPAPQPNLQNCARYKELSCCGTNTDSVITNANAGQTGQIFGYDWNGCGQLSPACEQFFIDQACFFECDPYQVPWINPTYVNSSTFFGYPICDDYCSNWFEACKNDFTCGYEWLVSYQPVENANGKITGYSCNSNTTCLTFADVYENGHGLCDMLWGTYYHYSEDDQNCATWDFSGSNPHKYMWKEPYGQGYCDPYILNSSEIAAITLGVLLGVTLIGCSALVAFLIYRERRQNPLFGVPMKQLN